MLNKKKLVNILCNARRILKLNLEGDFVECGIWKGGSVALMAHYLKSKEANRNLHLFDAFDDICEPDAEVDGLRAIQEVGGKDNAQGRLQPVTGFYQRRGGSGQEKEVEDLITSGVGYDPALVHIHKGWFQDTLPISSQKIKSIALLRLDGDWYASTKVCLEHLYDLVCPGGVIIVDDYRAYEGCQKAVDEFLENRKLNPAKHEVDGECVYWFKGE